MTKMSEETPQTYNLNTLGYAAIYGTSAIAVANTLNFSFYGITATAITGAILEEVNDRFESGSDFVEQAGADLIFAYTLGFRSHSSMQARYGELLAAGPAYRAR